MMFSIYKYSKYLLVSILFVNSLLYAQVGINTTSPDASAMLDITSTTKGLLVPRMTTAQREAIADPAVGLILYDIDLGSFFFNSGSSWIQFESGGEMVDADSDTGIEVERTTDNDSIYVKTAGTDRIVIDESGKIKLGNGVNGIAEHTGFTYIEADGSLSYQGAATRYEDFRIPTTSLKERDVDMPDWEVFVNDGSTGPGVYLHWFNDEDGSVNKEEELFFTMQLPHGWREGSTIYPHVHWTTKDDATGQVVIWGLEYVWTNVGETFSSTTSTIYTTSTTVGTPGTGVHIISAFPDEIDGSGHTLSSMLIGRIFRNSSNASDTFDGKKAGLLEIDFHYEIDADGSQEQYEKWVTDKPEE